MTVGAEQSKILFGIVLGVTVDVIDLQRNTKCGRMFAIPATLRTFLSTNFDQVPLNVG